MDTVSEQDETLLVSENQDGLPHLDDSLDQTLSSRSVSAQLAEVGSMTSFKQLFADRPATVINVAQNAAATTTSADVVEFVTYTSQADVAAQSKNRQTSYEAYESRPVRPLAKDVFKAVTGLPSPTDPRTSSTNKASFHLRKPKTPTKKRVVSNQTRIGSCTSDSDAGSVERAAASRGRKTKLTRRSSLEENSEPLVATYYQPYVADKYSPKQETEVRVSEVSSAKLAGKKEGRSVSRLQQVSTEKKKQPGSATKNGVIKEQSNEKAKTTCALRTRSLSASRIPLTSPYQQKNTLDSGKQKIASSTTTRILKSSRRTTPGKKAVRPQSDGHNKSVQQPSTLMTQSLDSGTLRLMVAGLYSSVESPVATAEQHSAAVLIQAFWRGVRVRAFDENIRRLKEQLRCKRLEQQVNALGVELKR